MPENPAKRIKDAQKHMAKNGKSVPAGSYIHALFDPNEGGKVCCASAGNNQKRIKRKVSS